MRHLPLVEMAVIETASESLFPKLSTSVVYRLKFPFIPAETQAGKISSSLIHDRLQSAHLFTFTAKWRLLPNRSIFGEALPRIYAASKTLLLLSFISKLEAFIVVPRHSSLTKVQDPRRNPFIPI